MHSVLLSLGQFQINSYGACLGIAFLLFYFLFTKLSRPYGFSSEFTANLLTVLIICGLVGARTFYVVEHWDFYSVHKEQIIQVWKGGLMFYGGLLTATAGLLVYIRHQKKSILQTFDIMATLVPIGHMFGRIGCFLNGCCYGRESDSSIAVCYPHNSIPWREQLERAQFGSPEFFKLSAEGARSLPVLPSQLFEAGLNLIIFIILMVLFKRQKRTGMQIAVYMMLYAIVRFIIETMRADERATFDLGFATLTISQTISSVLFIAGIVMIFILYKFTPTKSMRNS